MLPSPSPYNQYQNNYYCYPHGHTPCPSFQPTVYRSTVRYLLNCLLTLCPPLGLSLLLRQFTSPKTNRPVDLYDLPPGYQLDSLCYKGSTLQSYCWGTGPKTVYLMHGWESQAAHLSSLIPVLIQAGYRVIAFDAPGHGHSSKKTTHLADIAEAFKHIILQYGHPHAIVAHACGATATALMLKQNPQLIPDKLILIAPMRSLVSQLQDCATAQELLPTLTRQLEALIGMPITDTDIASNIQQVHCPGLVIHDHDDSIMPFGDAVTITEHLAQGHLVASRGLGHHNILKDPYIIHEISRFIYEP